MSLKKVGSLSQSESVRQLQRRLQTGGGQTPRGSQVRAALALGARAEAWEPRGSPPEKGWQYVVEGRRLAEARIQRDPAQIFTGARRGSRGISFYLQILQGLPWARGKGPPLCDPAGRTSTVGKQVGAPPGSIQWPMWLCVHSPPALLVPCASVSRPLPAISSYFFSYRTISLHPSVL